MALRVTRRPHMRKGFVQIRRGRTIQVSPSRVRGSTFLARDRGKRGRGPKVIPPLRKGTLGGPGFFDQPDAERRAALRKVASKIGERKVVGKLRAVQVLNKRTNPSLSAKAKADARFVAGSFRGRKFVGTGKGFGKNP